MLSQLLAIVCISLPFSLVFSLTFSLAPSQSYADTKKNEEIESEKERVWSFADQIQTFISSRILNWSDSIDTFFGVERLDREKRGSRLRLENSYTLIDGQDPVNNYKIRFRLALPKTQKRLNLVIDNIATPFEEQQGLAETSAGVTADDRIEESNALQAALRFFVLTGEKWNLNTDLGMKVKFPLNPFYRIRARREWTYGAWQMRISESIFWFKNDGIGQDTNAELDRQISRDFLFRWANRALWLEEQSEWNFIHSLNIFQRWSRRDGIAYSLGLNGSSEPSVSVDSYNISLSYRRRMYKNWAFLTVGPNISYPASINFVPVYSISFLFEARFGDIK